MNEQKKLDEQGIGVGAIVGIFMGAFMFDSFGAMAGTSLLCAFFGPAVLGIFRK